MNDITKVLGIAIFGTTLAIFSTVVFASGDVVDLRGKKGIVDPADLKKYDPKPPQVEKKAPPSPK
jgi:hypothetical protein